MVAGRVEVFGTVISGKMVGGEMDGDELDGGELEVDDGKHGEAGGGEEVEMPGKVVGAEEVQAKKGTAMGAGDFLPSVLICLLVILATILVLGICLAIAILRSNRSMSAIISGSSTVSEGTSRDSLDSQAVPRRENKVPSAPPAGSSPAPSLHGE